MRPIALLSIPLQGGNQNVILNLDGSRLPNRQSSFRVFNSLASSTSKIVDEDTSFCFTRELAAIHLLHIHEEVLRQIVDLAKIIKKTA